MLTESNPYACLGLMPGAPLTEVKRRYRELAKQYHPDNHGQTAGYEEKLRELNAAYAFLSVGAQKAAYDGRLAATFNPACAPQAVQPVAVPTHHIHSRKRKPLAAAVAFAICAFLSTGAGLFFTNSDVRVSFTSLFPQALKTAASSGDHTATVYYFMPESSPLAPQNSQASTRIVSSNWSQVTQP